ncbi:MAG TPA: MFS transporter [Stellaceae bacterium]|jgi:MFS family permease|nr:MFS transporter [Stellaceae bacterium]
MFKNRWWVLGASFFGNIVGPGPILVFSYAVLLRPATQALGVDRSIFSSASLVSTMVGLIAQPATGWLIDRYGARMIMVPSVLLFALGVSANSLLTANAAVIYLLFVCGNLFSGPASPLAFSIVIARWFDRMRGLALGIALAGIGVGTAVVPQFAAYLVAHYGWRSAYLGIAAAVVVFSWLPVALFIREPPAFDAIRAQQKQRALADQLPGMTARQAFKHWRWWALTISFFLGGVAINGTLAHVVALLGDRGVPIQAAASSLAFAGIALVFGRVIAGWALDRFNGPAIAAFCFAVPIVGILMLASGAGGLTFAMIATTLCGLGIGAEVDLMAFFLSRYFGLKAYGKIYGVSFACFNLGNTVGALGGSLAFDHLHSYTPAFLIFAGALVVACLLFLTLGAYTYPARREAALPAGEPGEATV